MGKVIADATVLSNFLIVDGLSILVKAISNLCTTREVFKEIKAGVERGVIPAANLNQIEILEMTPEEKEIFSRISEKLGRGEASCLAIAMSRGFRILTDDWDARKYAQKLSIPVSGTIGVLVSAVDRDVITKVQGNNLLSKMIKAGFYSPIDRLDEVL